MHDNFVAAVESLQLSDSEVVTLVKNSFLGSFLDGRGIERHLQNVDRHLHT